MARKIKTAFERAKKGTTTTAQTIRLTPKKRTTTKTAITETPLSLSDKGVLRAGGAGHAIFRDRSGNRIDLADAKWRAAQISIDAKKTPLGTVFYNDDLLGVNAYVKCTYTSFALYDKKLGFYYTRLVVRITDKEFLDVAEKSMRHLMGMDWCNTYCQNGVRFPWGFVLGNWYETRLDGELKRAKKQDYFFSEDGIFGLGDQYLYQIIDLTSFRKNANEARAQIEALRKNDLMIDGDTYVTDKNGNIHPYVGMLTGNYMWLPKGTLYGWDNRTKGKNQLTKNALFYELDTCILLDYQTEVIKKTQAELLKGKPTSFLMETTWEEEERPAKGWRIVANILTGGIYALGEYIAKTKYVRTDGCYEQMVKALADAIECSPINSDISGNIKFWVRRSEIFIEGQDIHYQSDELANSTPTTNGESESTKKSNFPWLLLGGALLSKFTN